MSERHDFIRFGSSLGEAFKKEAIVMMMMIPNDHDDQDVLFMEPIPISCCK